MKKTFGVGLLVLLSFVCFSGCKKKEDKKNIVVQMEEEASEKGASRKRKRLEGDCFQPKTLEDIIIALFNFKFIGRTLSKRPVGLVTASFIILIIIYVIVFSIWYSSLAGKFVNTTLDFAKPSLPSFDIINGRLTMHSAEPYVITHEEVYGIVGDAIQQINTEEFKGRYSKEIADGFARGVSNPKDSFCLVIDTTETYRQRINPEDYSKYTVITRDTMEIVDRIQSMPGNIVPIESKVKQDIRFTPDAVDRLRPAGTKIITTAIIVGMVLFTPAHFLLKALIASFIMWVIYLIIRREKGFSTLYKISIYALSPIVLLSVISKLWLPINGLLLQVVYFTCIIIAATAIPKVEQGSLKK